MQAKTFFNCVAIAGLTGLAACSQNEPRTSERDLLAEVENRVLVDRHGGGAAAGVSTASEPEQASDSDQTRKASQDAASNGVRSGTDRKAATAKFKQKAEALSLVREERSQTFGAAQQQAAAVALSMPAASPPVRGLLMQTPDDALPPSQDRENYAALTPNDVKQVADHPVSTFSVDVDTGSYANVRRFLSQGRLPPQNAVRVEELINNFGYSFSAPRARDTPFAVGTEMAQTPWNDHTQLLQIGIQGWKPQVKPVGTNLVFLVDVSGSMRSTNKLPLVKTALKMLLQELGANDRISLVVYAGASGVVLEPTPGDQAASISAALDRLAAGGSTNGGAGIQLAYAMAQQGWIEGGVNRVLLATDGDFNVGTTGFDALIDLVEDRRKSGIALTTLGFGAGNYNDHLMEQLADAGDGNHAYIDSVQEAHKILVRQRDATLTTIARDVKIQIEFNPDVVSEYRLIGYENRALKNSDFSNDAVDAGDIGSGHTVTALYEIALAGSGGQRHRPLRYGKAGMATEPGLSHEIAHLRLRYKLPEGGLEARSQLIEQAISLGEAGQQFSASSQGLKLAASVAAFGQLLSGGVYLDGFDYTDVSNMAEALEEDAFGDIAGFRQLVRVAGSLSKQAQVTRPDNLKIGG